MDIFERLAGIFGQLVGRGQPVSSAPARAPLPVAPRTGVNDALAYGVSVVSATPEPGAWYWQAVRVHHLTPEENGGNHHIYLDLLDPELGDESQPDGGRVFGARARITWDGGDQTIVVDKPLNEPGTNFPMWRWQVCAAEALGLPGQELPSDRVTGLHTGHPDEATGNTLFHHSFSITFVKVQAPTVAYTDSVIYGVIHNAGGRTVMLQQAEATLARQVVGADGLFRFTDLGAGEYVVALEDAALHSEPLRVDGRNQVQVELTLVLAESVIAGQVRNGVGRTLRLLCEDVEVATALVAEDETYRFAGLSAGEYRVLIAGTAMGSPLLAVDGSSAVTADLIAPAPDKPLAHYVLFGPPEAPATLANLLLAQDYLLTFEPSFGFSPAEAANAGLVTIIAGSDAVSPEVESQLAADGVPVQRIAGPVEEVAELLAARIAARQAF